MFYKKSFICPFCCAYDANDDYDDKHDVDVSVYYAAFFFLLWYFTSRASERTHSCLFVQL